MGNSMCHGRRRDRRCSYDAGAPGPVPVLADASRSVVPNGCSPTPNTPSSAKTSADADGLRFDRGSMQADSEVAASPGRVVEQRNGRTTTAASTLGTEALVSSEVAVSVCSIILQTPEEMMEDVQILRPIGAGAFAVVYRGVYKGCDAAVKLTSVDAGHVRWTEAAVATQLRHPNVVHTHTARAAKVTKEFHDRMWAGVRSGPGAQGAAPRAAMVPDLLLMSPSGDSTTGGPPKGAGSSSSELEGWRDALFRVGAAPNRGLLVLVQEFCNKGSLIRAIRNHLFSTAGKSVRSQLLARRVLLRTAVEICRGMGHLHDSNIIHGDLKPANVLLVGSNEDCRGFSAKIADFGLARMLQGDADRVESASTGTLPYMSPEALRGVHSRESDVYAFGMLLWEMMTEQRPYSGIPVGQVMLGVSFQGLRPKWPDEEWPELCAVGRSCLAQDPAERPSFRDLEERLVGLEEAVREEIRRQCPKPQHDPSRRRSQLARQTSKTDKASKPVATGVASEARAKVSSTELTTRTLSPTDVAAKLGSGPGSTVSGATSGGVPYFISSPLPHQWPAQSPAHSCIDLGCGNINTGPPAAPKSATATVGLLSGGQGEGAKASRGGATHGSVAAEAPSSSSSCGRRPRPGFPGV